MSFKKTFNKVSGNWQGRAVIQVVVFCCLGGFEALGWVWIAPDPERATGRCPCIGPTTQPLCQGPKSRKNETRRAAQHINALRSAGPWILIPREDISLFPLQSCDKTCNSSHVPILSMLCTLINFNASYNN